MAALTGCSSSTNASKEASAENPRKVVIGTGTQFKPYCYLDESGNLAGYELEVLKEIDNRLPQYEFDFETFDFKNILLSLGDGKVDIGAHQFEKNPDREASYLFGTESYTTFILRIVVDKDRTDINGIDDLQGKTVEVSEGSNDAWVLEDYNKKHQDNPIKLKYISNSDAVAQIQELEDGRIDAAISIKRIVDSWNKTYGDKVKTAGDPIASSSTYYIYRKDDTQLQQDIDAVLKELKEDGTLAQISIDVLGGDYTTTD
ncbi:transporter substrate-binding domain-containing protein [Clostridium aminobutyricum]|uniref:Transporter substrate-binding domain-containing protein n=2 Tax=Clostridium aminobutyricum TaxID=33953 RepID=A0A939D6X1_CLOAM|nr:transporter substrate-binding domain-containing protein [Clostridium aminobutyricum]